MTAKHTPGRWFLNPDDMEIRAEDGDDTPWVVAQVDRDCGCNADEPEANAHLISAAPDLLDASPRAAEMLRIAATVLRDCPKGLSHFYDEAHCDAWCIADDCESAADDIDAAVTKATGGDA